MRAYSVYDCTLLLFYFIAISIGTRVPQLEHELWELKASRREVKKHNKNSLAVERRPSLSSSSKRETQSERETIEHYQVQNGRQERQREKMRAGMKRKWPNTIFYVA